MNWDKTKDTNSRMNWDKTKDTNSRMNWDKTKERNLMIDFTVAYDKLASLETSKEIAELFTEYGVKALPFNPQACAISNWINEVTGLPIRTNFSQVRVVDSEHGYNTIESKPITLAMLKFMVGFDSGAYPDLIDVARFWDSPDTAGMV